jgi:hypothetical protein
MACLRGRQIQRLHGENAQFWVVASQGMRRTVNGVRRAHSMHKGVDAMARLLPDLLAERVIAGFAVPIVELVAPPMSWLSTDLSRSADHLLNERFGDLSVSLGSSAILAP